MRNTWSWSRPTPRLYSYNTDPATFSTGSYSSYSDHSRAARSASVALSAERSSAREARATTMAPAPAAKLSGYSGYYTRQLALMDQKQAASSTVAAAMANSKTTVAASSSATSTTEQKSTTTVERSSKIDTMKEFQASLQYGKQSRSQALRRAEVHALKSGNDPRHTLVPRNMDDDICKKVSKTLWPCQVSWAKLMCLFISCE